jgi:glycogen debranching enzyme
MKAAGEGVIEGVTWGAVGATFVLYSTTGTAAWLCLFDASGEIETARLPMARDGDHFTLHLPDAQPGLKYGYRLDGLHDPDSGRFHDPAKLLADPYATRFDRRWAWNPLLAASRSESVDTASLVPKAILEKPAYKKAPRPCFSPGGFIYEANVRALTMLHPDVPDRDKGTLAALAHPAVIKHLQAIGVDAIELMPVTAGIDERHLAPLGLSNAWGYNPVTFMAIDPRLAPGGIADLKQAVAALRKAGIGVILDLVFNHSGESDRFGAVVSMRGIDNATYYRAHEGQPGHLTNDAGTGNTIACDNPVVRRLIIASLRHFVLGAGVDGFRFDLAPILGRSAQGYSRDAALLNEICSDPVLKDRVLIAEPWDIGPGGYQLGNFPQAFLEWNDRARDDLRRFWRGDDWTLGALATRLAGSADIFNHNHAAQTRSVNFLAAHDGFTLADLVAHEGKHNAANGEGNRDGHNENHSWNNGVEGATDDTAIIARRRADLKALLSTLFATRGTLMLTAGDEFGRSQHGNNNAYAQDNAAFWVDWSKRDAELEAHVAALAGLRKCHPALSGLDFLSPETAAWLRPDGQAMHPGDWDQPDAGAVAMILHAESGNLAVMINRTGNTLAFTLPEDGWRDALTDEALPGAADVAPRAVRFAAVRRRLRPSASEHRALQPTIPSHRPASGIAEASCPCRRLPECRL